MSQTQNPKKPDNKADEIDFNQLGKRFSRLMHTAGQEFKRTTAIGKKMLSATKSNTTLHEKYEKLGMLLEAAIASKELDWENKEVHRILSEISTLKQELDKFEEDVKNIKSQK